MMMMSTLDVPAWVAWVTAVLVLLGSVLTLTGNIGLVRLRIFYDRVHAPTLGATLGAGGILLASILYFSMQEKHLVLMPVLISVFMTVTTPVALIMLARAALYRDRSEGHRGVPHDD